MALATMANEASTVDVYGAADELLAEMNMTPEERALVKRAAGELWAAWYDLPTTRHLLDREREPRYRADLFTFAPAVLLQVLERIYGNVIDRPETDVTTPVPTDETHPLTAKQLAKEFGQ